MSVIHRDDHDHVEPALPSGEELALKLFTLVMTGLVAVILLMIVLGDW